MLGQITNQNPELSRTFYTGILLSGVFISSISQVLLKKAAQKQYESKIKEYVNFQVIFAYFLFFGTTLLAVYAYKGVPLSWGPILESTGYLYVTFWGVKLFQEKINARKLLSLLLIILGIAIYAILG